MRTVIFRRDLSEGKIKLNGKQIAEQMNGYTGFFVDLTEHMIRGKTNRLRVTVDNTQVPNSRWYTGSGIYRDVTLYAGNRLHIRPKGIEVCTVDEKRRNLKSISVWRECQKKIKRRFHLNLKS